MAQQKYQIEIRLVLESENEGKYVNTVIEATCDGEQEVAELLRLFNKLRIREPEYKIYLLPF